MRRVGGQWPSETLTQQPGESIHTPVTFKPQIYHNNNFTNENYVTLLGSSIYQQLDVSTSQ